MIDGSKKRNHQLAFELQNSHVCEKRSKKEHLYKVSLHVMRCKHSYENFHKLEELIHRIKRLQSHFTAWKSVNK